MTIFIAEDVDMDALTAVNPDGFFADLTDSVSSNYFLYFLGCLFSVGGCEGQTSCGKRIIRRK